jgi:hypothetical protein
MRISRAVQFWLVITFAAAVLCVAIGMMQNTAGSL